MVEEDGTMHCYRCSKEDPEYTVVNNLRRCTVCGNDSVLSVPEMMDVLNDLYLKGVLKESYLSDYIDEEFEPEPLNFDTDDDCYRIEEADVDDYRDLMG